MAYQGTAGRGGFEQDQRHAFVGRGQDADVTAPVDGGGVIYETEEFNVLMQAVFADEAFRLIFQWAITSHDQIEVDATCAQDTYRCKQAHDAFMLDKAAYVAQSERQPAGRVIPIAADVYVVHAIGNYSAATACAGW